MSDLYINVKKRKQTDKIQELMMQQNHKQIRRRTENDKTKKQ